MYFRCRVTQHLSLYDDADDDELVMAAEFVENMPNNDQAAVCKNALSWTKRPHVSIEYNLI